MSRAIVGYTGFVGSNLLQFYKFDYFYNSSNFHEAANLEFDELFFCGVPAVKWYANKYPEYDTSTINNIKQILKTIKAKKIILISTIDVYEYTDLEYTEDYKCDILNNHTYGINRYMFEDFIQKNFTNYHIIRLPALFGKGLKKNIIYDLITNNNIQNISTSTYFQWYDLNWLKNDIDIIIKQNIDICNLFTEPISTFEIIKLFDYPVENFNNNSNLKYNTKTKYHKLFNSQISGYIRNKESVLHNIRLFLKQNNIDKSKLVVSNICVKDISNFQFSCILKLFGIQNIQIAPTTLIKNWDNLQELNFEQFNKNNISVYSFQSISYGLNNLNIFDIDTSDSFFNHMKKMINFGILNNVKVFVFGCPKNRQILDINNNNNDEIFCNFFKRVGEYIGDNNLTICLEPNSKKYGCNYLNKIKEVGDIVKQINHKNIKMMVDIGNAIMENDNLTDMYMYKDVIYNIDISQENMLDFSNITQKHIDFKKILSNINYNKNINLEMLIKNDNDDGELIKLKKSLENFINIYGSI